MKKTLDLLFVLSLLGFSTSCATKDLSVPKETVPVSQKEIGLDDLQGNWAGKCQTDSIGLSIPRTFKAGLTLKIVGSQADFSLSARWNRREFFKIWNTPISINERSGVILNIACGNLPSSAPIFSVKRSGDKLVMEASYPSTFEMRFPVYVTVTLEKQS